MAQCNRKFIAQPQTQNAMQGREQLQDGDRLIEKQRQVRRKVHLYPNILE